MSQIDPSHRWFGMVFPHDAVPEPCQFHNHYDEQCVLSNLIGAQSPLFERRGLAIIPSCHLLHTTEVSGEVFRHASVIVSEHARVHVDTLFQLF